MPSVTYELIDHVAVITLNRPDALNTFNADMYTEFNESTARFRDDSEAWVALITASGDRAFSAGVDIKALDQAFGASKGNVDSVTRNFSIDMQGEFYSNKPILVAIQGFCIGEGLSIALAGDLRIAAEDASFMLPEGRIGVPTINASIHGANKIGPAAALELLLLGEPRDSNWALRTGLVNRVVPTHQLQDSAMNWARKIACTAPLANQLTKEVVVQSRDRSFSETVANASAKRDLIVNGHDAQEGRRAFMEKREARFKGE